MTTVNDVITRAFRKLGVSGMGEDLDAEQIAEGLDVYNDMVFAWKLKGADTTHTLKAATDSFPLGNEYIEGTVYLLASRLSPNFEVPQSFDADEWLRELQAAFYALPTLEADSALLNLAASRWYYE